MFGCPWLVVLCRVVGVITRLSSPVTYPHTAELVGPTSERCSMTYPSMFHGKRMGVFDPWSLIAAYMYILTKLTINASFLKWISSSTQGMVRPAVCLGMKTEKHINCVFSKTEFKHSSYRLAGTFFCFNFFFFKKDKIHLNFAVSPKKQKYFNICKSKSAFVLVATLVGSSRT